MSTPKMKATGWPTQGHLRPREFGCNVVLAAMHRWVAVFGYGELSTVMRNRCCYMAPTTGWRLHLDTSGHIASRAWWIVSGATAMNVLADTCVAG